MNHSHKMRKKAMVHGQLDVNQCDSKGFTPLFVAAQNGHTKKLINFEYFSTFLCHHGVSSVPQGLCVFGVSLQQDTCLKGET